MIEFTVHGKAAPAGSKRGFARGGRVIIADANPNARPWKALVIDRAVQAMGTRGPILGPIQVNFTFHVSRPRGHLRKDGTVRPSAPLEPTVKPDLLKLARGVEDALIGICYHDDAQITFEVLRKTYTAGPPRVDIRIVESGLPATRTLTTKEEVAA